MAIKVTGLSIWVHVQLDHVEPYLVIDYTPIALDAETPERRRELTDYKSQFQTKLVELQTPLQSKLARLSDYAVSWIKVPEIDFGDMTARGTVTPVYLQVVPRNTGRIFTVVYRVSSGLSQTNVPITDATKRLIENIWPMCEQLAWDHLRGRLGAPTTQTSPKRKVYLSYRKGSATRRAFVEGIADRLGREGFFPWFDEWEIMAGDSLPREIAIGLQDVYAIIVVLTADYPGGKWAREELENAITQRVERNIKIIPVLYEPCERPALLQPLRYVNCTLHEPDQFERVSGDHRCSQRDRFESVPSLTYLHARRMFGR